MIVRPHAPPLTVAEYRNLPETGPRCQLIEGDLYMAPAPNRFHQDVSRNLMITLANYLSAHPVGVLYDSPFDVYLTEINVFQPDLLVVLNENRPAATKIGFSAVEFCSQLTSWTQLSESARRSARRKMGMGRTTSGASCPVTSIGARRTRRRSNCAGNGRATNNRVSETLSRRGRFFPGLKSSREAV